MKLRDTFHIDVGASDARVIRGGIDPESWGRVFEAMLTYSRPIDSLVRELASNCFDSHQEARLVPSFTFDDFFGSGYRPVDWTEEDETLLKEAPESALRERLEREYERVREHFSAWQERPVEIEITWDSPLSGGESAIIFRDFGVGLSPWRVETIYAFFASSTKRTSNDMLGAFGIGSKSPLGYRNDFTVSTTYFGVRTHYLVRKGLTGMEIDVLGSEEVGAPNGTEVTVPISRSDAARFRQAVREQLAYFPEINYIGCNVEPGTVYRGESFVYRTNSPFASLHLCIEGVYYPLDTGAAPVPIYASYIPVGLRFSLDELGHAIMDKREHIRYTPDVVAAIQKKWQAFMSEANAIRAAQLESIQTMDAYMDAFLFSSRDTGLEIAEGVVVPNVSKVIHMTPRYPKYHAVIPDKDPFSHWEAQYAVTGDGTPGKAMQSVRDLVSRYGENIFIAPKERMSRRKSRYMLETNSRYFYTIRERDSAPGFPDPLSPSTNGMTFEQKARKAFREEASECIYRRFPHYDDVVVPPEVIERIELEEAELKRQLEEEKQRKKTIINVRRYIYDNSRRDVGHFEMDTMTVGRAEAYRGIVVYGFMEDRQKLLDHALMLLKNRDVFEVSYNIYSLRRDRVEIMWFSKEKEKYFLNNPNAIHVDKIIASKHKPLVRTLTAHKINSLMSGKDWERTVNNLSKYGHHAGVEARQRATRVADYLKHYLAQTDVYSWKYHKVGDKLISEHFQDMADLLEDQGLLDGAVMEDAYWLSAFFEKYPLLSDIDWLSARHLDELSFYMKAKGAVNPLLLQRLKAYKAQKLLHQASASVSGDGMAQGIPVLEEVDISV